MKDFACGCRQNESGIVVRQCAEAENYSDAVKEIPGDVNLLSHPATLAWVAHFEALATETRNKARFTHDGYPTNLEAAAADALKWLQTFRDVDAIGMMGYGNGEWHRERNEARAALGRCVDALSKFVAPCLPAEFGRAYPNTVAEIVTANEQEATANA